GVRAERARTPSVARLAQCLEGRAQLLAEALRLFPGGEVAAPVDLVEVGDVRVALLDPASRGSPDLTGESGETHRERDWRRHLPGRAGRRLSALPVLPSRRDPRARQPVQRDVVEDVVPRQIARWLLVYEGARDLVVGVGVVVQHPG